MRQQQIGPWARFRIRPAWLVLWVIVLCWPLDSASGALSPAPSLTDDLGAGPSRPVKISPWVLDQVADGRWTDFLVILSAQADLRPAATLVGKQVKGRFVRETLWAQAQHSQAALRAWLDARAVPYRAFYIVNLIHVLRGDRALLDALAARPDVARIEANPRIYHARLQPAAGPQPQARGAVEWNIAHVGAPQVWAMGYTGQGIVIGGQDTGYDWDHPALIAPYRGWDGSTAHHDGNWHDAIHTGGGNCGPDAAEPCDDDGHGTITMGIAVGDDRAGNQIGVAPGARWIGCRNMDQGFGTPATYLECFEFFLAPYPVGGAPAEGDPDLAPDVTNNSWDCPPFEGCSWDILQAAVEAQRAAGIMTVVSAGNRGSACGTINAPPAIYDAAYTVGATDGSDTIASFSGRGPVSVDGSNRLKPDIAAPGVNIRSSASGGGYWGFAQGTSMSSPHVAGTVALIWSAQPALRNQIGETEAILNAAAVPLGSTQCGDLPGSVPNNVYGWGRLDALAAVNLALDDTVCWPVSGVDFSVDPPRPTVGDQVTFSAAVSAGSRPITYTWNFDGDLVGSGPVVTRTFAATTTPRDYTVTLTAANRCPSEETMARPITVVPHTAYLPIVPCDCGP
ncbi:MAG: S8 family serine peptidase [Anaerolineae bacterium]|nr:S8 family serine peptidase [Anaerolineae bacterium]